MTNRKQRANGYKVLSVHLKEETMQKLDATALKMGCSRDELIGIYLEYAIRHTQIKE